ncbi:MAG: helix-turn-helix transcriptional regulator [Bacteroidota bacterium]
MDISEKVGIRLKSLRKELNITQEKLAEKADLDTTYISEVENGKRNITIASLQKILLALDQSFVSFFNDKVFE